MEERFSRDGAAKAAGVTALIGTGVSPGLTNMMAAWGARQFKGAVDIECEYATFRPINPSEGLLETALRQFFSRAILDSASMPAASADAGFVLDEVKDPSTISLRWFGTRYTLRARGSWTFTPHEVRLVRAIGAVLAARYLAVLNPRIVAERGDLFRGAIEDRYVGALFDPESYTIDAREARADRIASIIELLRVAALSSYENRPITTGILLARTAGKLGTASTLAALRRLEERGGLRLKLDRKSTRLNSSHMSESRMPSSA